MKQFVLPVFQKSLQRRELEKQEQIRKWQVKDWHKSILLFDYQTDTLTSRDMHTKYEKLSKNNALSNIKLSVDLYRCSIKILIQDSVIYACSF